MKNAPRLLRDKDFRVLESAFDNRKEYKIEVSLGDYSLQVSVIPASSVWEQPMMVQARQSRGLVDEIKNCVSVQELRGYLYG